MKRVSAILCTLALSAAIAVPAAASSAPATGRAVVLRPIAVVNTADLDFGTILRGTAAGRVVIAPGTGTRTATGGAVLAGGTPQAAAFTISGTARRVVTVSVTPGSVLLANGTGGSMTVNTFRLNGAANRTLSAAGTNIVRVGARLNLAANQADGTYSGSFNLSVDYQ